MAFAKSRSLVCLEILDLQTILRCEELYPSKQLMKALEHSSTSGVHTTDQLVIVNYHSLYTVMCNGLIYLY